MAIQFHDPAAHPAAAGVPIQAIDHLELWVGNAYQAAQFYRTALGFDVVGYQGPETGHRDHASYALRQGAIRLAVTAPLTPGSPIAHHVAWHGDGVRAIAFRVPNPDAAVRHCRERGARPAMYERWLEDEHGAARLGAIHAYGDTVHTFVQYADYDGPFLPGYREVTDLPGRPLGLKAIDHVVANVELGQMETWARFYRDVLGFTQLVHFTDEQIGTEYTALMSKVMQGGRGRVKLPINEPAPGRRKSQIQEFLDFYGGPGVQHIALITGDILATVRELRARGLRFLRVPDTYYDHLGERVGAIREDLAEIRNLGILVDRDDEGYLLQIFTRPVTDRPTLFFEIIQRRGARGFGVGNFKALFEAIELEQAARGNL